MESFKNRFRISNVFLFVVMFFLVGCSISDEAIGQHAPFGDNNIVAHRGAWKRKGLPQNSIASLKKAIELKCNGSEFDVRITADDSLVVNHDPVYNGLLIEDTKYSQLLRYKLSNGEKLPTLSEYFKAGVTDNYDIKLFCEIKADYNNAARLKLAVERVYSLIKTLKLEQKVVVASFDYLVLERILSYDNSIECQYLKGDVEIDKLERDNIGAGYIYRFYMNNATFVEEAKNRGIILNVWTVNDNNSMNYCLDAKMNYITTDEPEWLYDIEQSKK